MFCNALSGVCWVLRGALKLWEDWQDCTILHLASTELLGHGHKVYPCVWNPCVWNPGAPFHTERVSTGWLLWKSQHCKEKGRSWGVAVQVILRMLVRSWLCTLCRTILHKPQLSPHLLCASGQVSAAGGTTVSPGAPTSQPHLWDFGFWARPVSWQCFSRLAKDRMKNMNRTTEPRGRSPGYFLDIFSTPLIFF